MPLLRKKHGKRGDFVEIMFTLKNCKIIDKEELVNIVISEGKIKNIGNDLEGEVIDVNGKLVMPGIIDSHVHFRDFEQVQKEDFFTGSCSAVAGGVTTILDMPNTIPPVVSVEILEKRRKEAEKSIVNYGFHFGATIDNLGVLEKVKNVASIKVFMDASTGNMLIEDDKILKNIFENCKIITVHAEDENLVKAVKFCKNNVHLLHVTLKKEIDFLRENKKQGITVEVTPHHLFLTDDDVKELREFGIMLPSLKEKEDQNALWKAINKGIVDTIGSDHAPHLIEEKKSQNPPFGVPGVETLLPLMLNAVNEKRITLKKLHELCCYNPAKIFRIKNKGFIKEDYDADLCVVDMDLEKEIENNKLHTKCKWSPFNGMKLKGWPVMTIVNGNIVFKDGKIENVKAKEVEFLN